MKWGSSRAYIKGKFLGRGRKNVRALKRMYSLIEGWAPASSLPVTLCSRVSMSGNEHGMGGNELARIEREYPASRQAGGQ